MIFYKHFIGDYQRKTAALSMVEHGAYRLMLDEFYATGMPLPSDRRALYRLVRADGPAERKAVDTILRQFWHEGPQGWVNARALEEITKADTKSDTNRTTALAREAARRAAREEHERAQEREHEPSTETAPRAGDHSHSQKPEKALPPSSSAVPATPDPEPDPPLPTTTSDPLHARAIEIAVLLRKRGAGLTASDPRVRTWAANPAATDAQLLTALDTAKTAREKTRDPTAINAGYLDTILGNQITGTPTYDIAALQRLVETP